MTVNLGTPTWTSYDVNGATLADVVAAIEQLAEAGDTSWSQSHYTEHHDEAGQVDSVDVTVVVTVSLPHWVERDHATPQEQAEWDRFLQALHAHEQGHADLVHSYLEHVDAHMVGLDRAGAGQMWHDTLANLQDASDAYDASNDHGRNAGTTLIVP